MITTIYRTGQMSAPTHNEDVLQYWFEFDSRRPAGHVSRSEALFASPDLQGANFWLSSRIRSKQVAFNEITVESDSVRVYCVHDYNDVGGFYYGEPSERQINYIDNYWENSMTLTEWMSEVGEDLHGDWEILLTEKEVISSRALTYSELRELYQQEGLDELAEDLSMNIQGNPAYILTTV